MKPFHDESCFGPTSDDMLSSGFQIRRHGLPLSRVVQYLWLHWKTVRLVDPH